jgi:hypothetical protein
MSDEKKRENWYSGAVGRLDLPERRTLTTSSVSDVKPIPAGNSSPKSENGSEAMFADLEEENERRQRAAKTHKWMQKNHALVEEERKASEESRRAKATQDRFDKMERMLLETQEQIRQLTEAMRRVAKGG